MCASKFHNQDISFFRNSITIQENDIKQRNFENYENLKSVDGKD